jgi:transglutaminase-like putative cysteine protease
MKDHFQIPRYSLMWLLSSLTLIMLPHVLRLPVWLSAVFASCIVLRVLIYQGRISNPGSRIKTVLVFAVLAVSIFQYGRNFLSTDTMIGILMVGIALKLLEMHRQRDVLLVIMLSYFASMSEFIYSQTIPVALYMMFAVLLNTCALMSLHQNQQAQQPRRTFRLASVILLQSVPLMLALFILFPRISPLWAMPMQSNSAISGLSDSMQPGDISSLIQSADVAFKVQFEAEIPRNELLYWRGLTLDLFNGRTWSRRGSRFDPATQNLSENVSEFHEWYQDIEWIDDAISYNVIMEPTNQNWLFALKLPQIRKNGVAMNNYYQIETRAPVGQRYSYNVKSWQVHSVGEELDAELRRRSLLLPVEGNASSRQFATDMRAEAGTDQAYVESILNYFNQQQFFYTLTPRLLGDNSVDEFLFNSREGFCEHYASSFTFLMRAAGIPARVVTGYQGGERNPYDDTLIIRQFDAHAWSEVWIEGEGWVSVDPTAAVAPQRITQGSELTFQEDESFLRDAGFSSWFLRRNLLLNNLRLYVETIDYAWIRFVLNYDQGTQFAFFSRLFGTVTPLKILLVIGGFMAICASVLGWIILRPQGRKHYPPATRYYLKFCSLMASMGFARRTGETPADFCERVSGINPAWEGTLRHITRLYYELAYSTEATSDDEATRRSLSRLRKAVHQFQVMK